MLDCSPCTYYCDRSAGRCCCERNYNTIRKIYPLNMEGKGQQEEAVANMTRHLVVSSKLLLGYVSRKLLLPLESIVHNSEQDVVAASAEKVLGQ